MLNQSRIVERRRLIGHQRRAGNSAEMEGRLVGLEHAEVNYARSNQQAASVDNFSFRRNIHFPSGKNAVALQQKNTPLAGLPCRIDKSAVGYGEKSVHAPSYPPLPIRVTTSRQPQ